MPPITPAIAMILIGGGLMGYCIGKYWNRIENQREKNNESYNRQRP